MFNSKAFCVIVFLTTLVLGAAVYLQVQEMMEYNLLTKLKEQYLSGIFGDGGDAAEPAKDEDSSKKAADSDKKAVDSDKKAADSDKKAADSDKKAADSGEKDDKK